MVFLGIESSTDAASVALVNEDTLLGEITYTIKKSHSTQLMPMVMQLLDISGYTLKTIDGIGVSMGPGAFTGLRIGMTLANMLAYANDLPIIGISSLKGIAYNGKGFNGLLCPLIYSRKEEVYGTLYTSDLTPLMEEKMMPVKDFVNGLPKDQPILLLGDGPLKYGSFFESIDCVDSSQSIAIPKGSSIAYLAMAAFKAGAKDNPFSLKPDYFRPSEAELQWEQRNGNKD